MAAPSKSFNDYRTYYSLVRFMKKPIKWATRIGFIPETVYSKYFEYLANEKKELDLE